MDLLSVDNMTKVFKEFVSNPTVNYVPIYNALTKNYGTPVESMGEFKSYDDKWKGHPELFKTGFEPYTPSEDNIGFYHVASAGYDATQERKHRIYINPSVETRGQFVHTFMKECLTEGIDFYFKYARSDSRTDNFLIYASDEQLEQYSKLLTKIESNYPELTKSCSDTPLAATSAGWWAYGPEDKSSEKGSLSQRVSKIVRNNITKTLVENRHLFNLDEINQQSIQNLYKACIECKASKIEDSGERDVFKMGSHAALEQAFKNSAPNLANFILETKISDEAIQEDLPLITICAENGETLAITPSAVSTLLAGQTPHFNSFEERDQMYKTLTERCASELNEQGLTPPIPETLKNSNFEQLSSEQ